MRKAKINKKTRRSVLALLSVGAFALPTISAAQDFPSQPIKLIVPASPGGSTDVMGRILAKVMGEQNNVPVIVENRPGAAGSIGIQATINAKPDGYTIALTLPDTTSIYPLTRKVPPYTLKDLTPLGQVAYSNILMVVNAASPYKTVKDVIEASKTKKMAYGSHGYGTTAHLWIELFKNITGADMLHVPYKGAAPTLQALIGGEHEFMVGSPATFKPQLDAGRARPIAAGSATRIPTFPDVPTMVESGYPDYVIGVWFGVFGPPDLPAPIADKLNDMIVTAVKSPEYQKQASTFMFDTPQPNRAEFAKMVEDDLETWKIAFKAAGIEPDN